MAIKKVNKITLFVSIKRTVKVIYGTIKFYK